MNLLRPPGDRSEDGQEEGTGSALAAPPEQGAAEEQLEETFDRTVEEGQSRIARPLPALLATGLVGGIDVGFGALGYLVVTERTGSTLLGALAFSIGFIAITLAGSELFTESFLVPVHAVVARKASIAGLLRLWAGTLAANLVGGWVFMWLVVLGFPALRPTVVETGRHYAELGVTGRSFALALLAGAAITLLTWAQHAVESPGIKLVPAVAFAFLLTGGQLFHSVIDSHFMFGGLHTGSAPYGYLDWLGALGWSVLGNVIGGLGLVTVLRLLQVPHKVSAERAQNG